MYSKKGYGWISEFFCIKISSLRIPFAMSFLKICSFSFYHFSILHRTKRENVTSFDLLLKNFLIVPFCFLKKYNLQNILSLCSNLLKRSSPRLQLFKEKGSDFQPNHFSFPVGVYIITKIKMSFLDKDAISIFLYQLVFIITLLLHGHSVWWQKARTPLLNSHLLFTEFYCIRKWDRGFRYCQEKRWLLLMLLLGWQCQSSVRKFILKTKFVPQELLKRSFKNGKRRS